MERFYLQNAKLYRQLVEALDVSVPAPHFSRHKAASTDRVEPTVVVESNIVTTARIRPMLPEDDTAGFPCAVYPTEAESGHLQTVYLHDLYNHPRGRPVLRSGKHDIDRLYDQSTSTEQIYEDLVADLVAFAQQGSIGTLFAYGQTGSGKTFTISELQRLSAVALTDGNALERHDVYVTIVDLAGNSAFDLLDSRKPIQVLQDASGETQLAGATEHQVRSTDDMLNIIEQAASYRRTASTLRNDASSRSHSVCRIRIHDKAVTNTIDGILFLVDLAGSEAARDTAEHDATRMRETKEINMSLSVLKDCIRGQAESEILQTRGNMGRAKINGFRLPIRQSTLTRVLKHVFEPYGHRLCKTAVIACLNPSLADVASTKNTLRYAEMLRAPITAA